MTAKNLCYHLLFTIAASSALPLLSAADAPLYAACEPDAKVIGSMKPDADIRVLSSRSAENGASCYRLEARTPSGTLTGFTFDAKLPAVAAYERERRRATTSPPASPAAPPPATPANGKKSAPSASAEAADAASAAAGPSAKAPRKLILLN